MARTIVITGGTHGIGLALAGRRLAAGDTVVAVSSNPANGERFLAGARDHGDRARFVAADLVTVEGTRRAAGRIAADHPVVDALVLGANRVLPRREVTADGFEAVFALYHLSRRLLATDLREQLENAERPVVVNLAGPGITRGAVHWDDPHLARGWSIVQAQLQAGRANDLLAVALGSGGGRLRSIVYNPGFVDTRPYTGIPQPWRAPAELAAMVAAAPPARAATAIGELIDSPPPPGFSAWRRHGTTNRPIDPTLPTFAPADADRLDTWTRTLLEPHRTP